jgi:transposase InsO family protein
MNTSWRRLHRDHRKGAFAPPFLGTVPSTKERFARLGILTIGDELLDGEVFYSFREAKIVIEKWRVHYNTVRPHSALGYRPPAPESIILMDRRHVMH